MKNQGLYQLFIEELEDMYSAELQMTKALPKLIKLASLPDLKEALAHHLKETEHELTVAKEQAEVSNRIKTDFIRNMEHDIRTPISGIWGMVEILSGLNPGDKVITTGYEELDNGTPILIK